jgi:membrane-bound serine protease (ClpP class)
VARLRHLLLAVLGFAALVPGAAPRLVGATALAPPAAAVLEVSGAIGPATSRFVVRGLEAAQERGDRLLILQLDTPGGLDTSMRDIIRAILAARIPVVAFVAPSGARAASAGTYILYACHVAAMAPATNLGAATPVAIGGESSPQREPPAEREPQPTEKPPAKKETQKETQKEPVGEKEGDSEGKSPATPEQTLTAMERKTINDAVAYIRGLAELRNRNADWAERAVRGAASLSASAALSEHVIELIARDVPDLLAQLDGRQVKVADRTVTLQTRGLAIVRVEPDWRTRLLAVITNPTLAYGLLLVGIYGLLLEGYNPGAVLPGVVGAISLLLALFAFQILSVNYAGLALIAVGVGLIIAEFFLPTFGSLGVGGLIAFVVGSIILLDSDVPGLNIALPVIAGVATAGGLMLLGLVYLATRSLRRPVVTGTQTMVGTLGEAFEDFGERGRVRYGGELWNARSSAPVRAGQPVRIVRVEGLLLWVEPS